MLIGKSETLENFLKYFKWQKWWHLCTCMCLWEAGLGEVACQSLGVSCANRQLALLIVVQFSRCSKNICKAHRWPWVSFPTREGITLSKPIVEEAIQKMENTARPRWFPAAVTSTIIFKMEENKVGNWHRNVTSRQTFRRSFLSDSVKKKYLLTWQCFLQTWRMKSKFSLETLIWNPNSCLKFRAAVGCNADSHYMSLALKEALFVVNKNVFEPIKWNDKSSTKSTNQQVSASLRRNQPSDLVFDMTFESGRRTRHPTNCRCVTILAPRRGAGSHFAFDPSQMLNCAGKRAGVGAGHHRVPDNKV